MKHSLIALAVVAALAGCNDKQDQQVATYPQTPAQAQQPQVVQPQVAGQPVQQAQQAPVQYQQQPQVVAQPAPQVIVQQPAQPVIVQNQHDNTGNMLAAGALGYMLGSAGNNNRSYDDVHRYDRVAQAPQREIVREKVIIKEKLVQAPAPVAPAQKPVPTYQTAPKPIVTSAVPAPSKYSQPSQPYKMNTPTYSYKSPSTTSTKH
jgi:uncharacterized protein YgiB involved in biofilm formation